MPRSWAEWWDFTSELSHFRWWLYSFQAFSECWMPTCAHSEVLPRPHGCRLWLRPYWAPQISVLPTPGILPFHCFSRCPQEYLTALHSGLAQLHLLGCKPLLGWYFPPCASLIYLVQAAKAIAKPYPLLVYFFPWTYHFHHLKYNISQVFTFSCIIAFPSNHNNTEVGTFVSPVNGCFPQTWNHWLIVSRG